MPELPEVERAAGVIRAAAKGRKISKVETTEDTIVYTGTSHTEFAQEITGRTLVDTGRYGKVFYLLLDGDGRVPVLHLGMTGAIQVRGGEALYYRKKPKQDPNDWPPKFMKFILHFEPLEEGGEITEIAFLDPRRLARIRLCKDHLNEPPISALGFDPILSMPPIEEFQEKVLKRGCPIKALLLDQSFSAGVGNWIADEVLFHSAVHPEQTAKSLSPEKIKLLYRNIEYVCKTAVEVNADSREFPSNWLFKHRWGKGKDKSTLVLPSGEKASIKWITVGGRTSAVVQQVQKLEGASKKAKKEKIEDDTESSASELTDLGDDTEDEGKKRKPGKGKRKAPPEPKQSRKKLKRSGLTQVTGQLTLSS